MVAIAEQSPGISVGVAVAFVSISTAARQANEASRGTISHSGGALDGLTTTRFSLIKDQYVSGGPPSAHYPRDLIFSHIMDGCIDFS